MGSSTVDFNLRVYSDAPEGKIGDVGSYGALFGNYIYANHNAL